MVGNEKICLDCGYPSLRPRGALARTLYNKQIADRHLAHMDHSQWYKVDQAVLHCDVRPLFHQCCLDAETEDFLNKSTEKSDNIFLQIFYSLVKLFLSLFMTQTSINGLLGRGSMAVFSTDQFQKLTGYEQNDLSMKRKLLDLGAGDGSVTKNLEPFFYTIHVTEVSSQMKRQLASKGYRVIDEENISDGAYDAVSCLNVLDRCLKPIEMLSSIRKAMKPDGVAVIALVLPFRAYVETGSADQKQLEDLGITGSTVEEQVNSLVTEVFPKAGFQINRWTRLPYLCEGDLSQAFYWLDDFVFILSIDQSEKKN